MPRSKIVSQLLPPGASEFDFSPPDCPDHL
jgi:hypothetical protein